MNEIKLNKTFQAAIVARDAAQAVVNAIDGGRAISQHNHSNLTTWPRNKQIKYLCELLELEIQDLAQAKLFREPGIPATELAESLGISPRTLYNWPGIGRTLRARRHDYQARSKGHSRLLGGEQ